MTPKEKAEELILKYLRVDNDTKEWFHKGLAKKCALTAVDEMIDYLPRKYTNSHIWYWKQVKQEIENL